MTDKPHEPGVPPPYTAAYTPLQPPPPYAQPLTAADITVINVTQWGPYSMQVVCPHCSATVMTETIATPGLLTWLLSGALVFLGCWLGCCLIPCCIPECQDITHTCPNCKKALGSYRRL